jgi:hypothetical protein
MLELLNDSCLMKETLSSNTRLPAACSKKTLNVSDLNDPGLIADEIVPAHREATHTFSVFWWMLENVSPFQSSIPVGKNRMKQTASAH